MFEVLGGMYGMPHAGKLAQDELIQLLNEAGYFNTSTSPSLFTHTSRDLDFTVTVDDFAINFKLEADYQHLVHTLESKYVITQDLTGEKYLGISFQWDYDNGVVELSMPGYVTRFLEYMKYTSTGSTVDTPTLYKRPNYGEKIQYVKHDSSELLSAVDTKWIQALVGGFLFYSQAIDGTMAFALSSIGSRQAEPTQEVMNAAKHLCQYAATHPNGVLVYRKSLMQLKVHSDASYLCETGARSRCGGFMYFGNANAEDDKHGSLINGPISVVSAILPHVVSSACEAEYGCLFLNSTKAAGIRQLCEDMRCPQHPTVIQGDNTCSIGIATNTVKLKQSKHMDMRFHWIRDRIKQGQFIPIWKYGDYNLADYSTKNQLAVICRKFRNFFVADRDATTGKLTGVTDEERLKGVLIYVSWFVLFTAGGGRGNKPEKPS